MKVNVAVRFNGIVAVEVPDGLTKIQAKKLAQKVVAAKILATTDNEDAPELDAFDELCEELKAKEGTPTYDALDNAWEQVDCQSVSGSWVAFVALPGFLFPAETT